MKRNHQPEHESVKRNRFVGRSLALLATLPIVLLACSATPDGERSALPATEPLDRTDEVEPPRFGRTTTRPLSLIARDFVNVLLQIDDFDPRVRTNVRFSRSATPFERAIEDIMVSEGYRVERVADRKGDGVIQTSVMDLTADESLGEIVYTVMVERIALRRSYRVNDNRVAPTSSLYVRGADAGLLSLNDSIFVDGSEAAR